MLIGLVLAGWIKETPEFTSIVLNVAASLLSFIPRALQVIRILPTTEPSHHRGRTPPNDCRLSDMRDDVQPHPQSLSARSERYALAGTPRDDPGGSATLPRKHPPSTAVLTAADWRGAQAA